MRAVVIDRLGSSQVLHMARVPKPRPGPGEVLIQVHFAGVNPADWKCREGHLAPFITYRFPFVLGFDLAGTVQAWGADVEGFCRGQAVFAQSDVGNGKWGSYAEYTCIDQQSVVPMPNNLSFAQAAAVPTPALAAWAGLFDDGGLQAGHKVLVHGGGAAVGTFAIQFAKLAGARVATTCGADKHGYVKSLGAELAIDYRTQDIHGSLRAWSADGVDLVLDCVGGASLANSLELLRPGGILVSILTLNPGETGPDHAAAARRGLRSAVTYSKMPSGKTLNQIGALLCSGRVQPPPIEILALEQVANAHDRLQRGEARTKMVLQVLG
ncbi:NADP-dependent oxidoreductase [Pseudomonas chlororaphis]|uniref:NADP-dependent oxidoreductase n=1 Tax=Pseudomonas chlororaphis TaxID=587753 RepID=UPI00209AEAEF|nr:NADP-dependent oxidoreductase [Pseudomonas chlororaphis]MCO7569201.1 NADP-dependent oxidoreductase [Pseudomonas chlororaphis]MCO7586954.1 NADP-dependent oxidoreductase [Pseudomonas chlororaphis]